MRSPMDGSDGPVLAEVSVNGTPLADGVEILSIRTSAAADGIPSATIVLADGDAANMEFPLTDSACMKPGGRVRVSLGYGLGPPHVIFAGVITAQSLSMDSERGRLTLTCRHDAIRARLHVPLVNDGPGTLADTVRSLLGEAAAQVWAAPAAPAPAGSSGASLWDRFVAHCRRRGRIVLAGPDGIDAPVLDPAAVAPVLTLTMGTDIIAFEAALDGATQPAGIETATPGGAPAPDSTLGGGWGNVTAAELAAALGIGVRRLSTADATWARAELLRARLATPIGRVSCLGTHGVAPGDRVELKGLGDRFSGTAFVSAAEHTLDTGTWTMTLGLGLPPQSNL